MSFNMKKNRIPKDLFLGMAVFGLMACSEGGFDSLEETFRGNDTVVSISLDEVPQYARTVVSSWKLAADENTYSEPVNSIFVENNFAVEADAILEEDSGYMTLASAGVDGDQDAWALRVENGKAIFAWRDASTDNQWYKVVAEDVLVTKDTITVRAERYGSLTVLYVNGVIEAAAESANAIEKVNGSFTIGFDPSEESENMPGRVLCVRFDLVRNIKNDFVEVSLDSSDIETDAPLIIDLQESPSSEIEVPSEEKWIADWEFNDPSNVGMDFSGNGHSAVVGEGRITVEDGIAYFDGKSGFNVSLESDLKINSFVVEARIKPTAFGSMNNILVSEPPGRYGDGWMIRADNGYLTVHFRDEDASYTDWTVFTGEKLLLNDWNNIRVERLGGVVKVFQNGVLTIDASYKGDVSQLTYGWGIGYDAMNQAYHNRYFNGFVDYIRFGSLEKMSEGSLISRSPYELLADWEFDAPDFIGLDKIANNTTHDVYGAEIKDDALVLDGKSGIVLPLTKTFLRNEFVVDVRLKPSSFSKIQNVLVAEPPGRYGDGWMIRVDDGALCVHLRDSRTHGIEWQVFEGKKLTLGQWTEVRVVRTVASIQVYQDGELTVDAPCEGDVSQLEYDLSIGFDGMNQDYNQRFFNGQIDYIRYYGIRQ